MRAKSTALAVLSLALAAGLSAAYESSATYDPRVIWGANPVPRAEKAPADADFVRLGPDTRKDAGHDVFVIGEDSQSYTARRWVRPFSMNRYETTYRLWHEVRTWAEQNGYSFSNPGQQGSSGRRGRTPTDEGMYQPVTNISWYDAVVWCNAFSEKDGRKPCYTYNGSVLRDSGDTAACDLAECDWDADGYRLPSEAEWEYAARKTKSGYQSGALPSGSVNDRGESDGGIPEAAIAWFDGNTNRTMTVGTAGTPFKDNAAPGTGNANASGLFDMSGNVLEYCWDWYASYTEDEPGTRSTGPKIGAERVSRGGSWSPYTGFIHSADRYAYDPNEAYNYMGFRVASTR